MDSIDKADAKLAHVVRQHQHVIINALHNQARHMDEAAKLAGEQYEAGKADPEVKAAQDRSMVTNNGYYQSFKMFRDDAAEARKVIEELEQAIEETEYVE